jgi:methyl-accepting chemotaxis protein/methyl-accepting chemotaxis protein-1 (serine sensor receptor)
VRAETKFNRDLAAVQEKSVQDTQAEVRWLIWIALIVAVAGGSALLFWIVGSVNRGLLDAVNRLSEGATQVASAAEQVSSSSQSLAQGSSEQAASLEETSACAEEISSMSKKNSDNCHTAAGLVAQSQNEFERAGQSLRDMVQAMNEINDSSGKISKIIKVIDEIAFQTNILALNAAVEAARAGEAGMGFAVVADEVRNLAQRCAQAAQDTSGLIAESIERSREGKLKVDSVAEGVSSIAEQVTKAKALMDEVYVGSQEQVRGIGEMAQALSQMERVTQSSAAGAEEGAAAAAELNNQSEAVVRVINDLSAMVGGGANNFQGAHRSPSASVRTFQKSGISAPLRQKGASAGLAALKTAVSKPAKSPIPVAAGRQEAEKALPLDDHFEEF